MSTGKSSHTQLNASADFMKVIRVSNALTHTSNQIVAWNEESMLILFNDVGFIFIDEESKFGECKIAALFIMNSFRITRQNNRKERDFHFYITKEACLF